MLKFIGLGKRHPSWSREQFVEHWFERHAPLILGVPAFMRHVRRYVQYHPLEGSIDDGWDAVSEIWFDDAIGLHAAFAEPDYLERVRPDELFLARLDAGFALSTEETQLWRGHAKLDNFQMFSFLRRRRELTRGDFIEYCRTIHGPLMTDLPDVRRILSECSLDLAVSTDASDPMNTGVASRFAFDGVITAKGEDVSAFATMLRDPNRGDVFEGDARFVERAAGLQLLRIPRLIHDAVP